jgi:ketosteroid isomerase-like protein
MRVLATVFVIAALGGCAMGPPNADTARADILSLQDQWAKARIAQDAAFLEQFYTQDFYVVSMDGGVVSREADIANFATKALKPDSIIDEDMDVRVRGRTATVTGVERLRGSYRGNTGAFTLRFTNVYVNEAGRWRLALHHATPLAGQ